MFKGSHDSLSAPHKWRTHNQGIIHAHVIHDLIEHNQGVV